MKRVDALVRGTLNELFNDSVHGIIRAPIPEV